MTDPKKNQKNFVSLFVFILLADFMARIAQATGDEVWEHLAMLWLGPLDDVFFALTAIQAFFYLIDPSGEKTLDGKGAHNHVLLMDAFKSGGEKELARNFLRGSQRALIVLPAVLALSLVASWLVASPVSRGALSFSQQHLAYVFPISMAVVLLLVVLRLGGHTTTYWKCATVSGFLLCAVAALDGRWQNHLYHMIANLENLQAWTVSISWAGLFAATTDQE